MPKVRIQGHDRFARDAPSLPQSGLPILSGLALAPSSASAGRVILVSAHVVNLADPDEFQNTMRGMLRDRIGEPNSNGNGHSPESHWHHRADELAGWTERRMVNRRDISGGYYIGDDGKVCLTTSHDSLTRPRIIRHYHATTISDVLGQHTTARVLLEPGIEACLSLWGAADIDQHGEGDFSAANESAAMAWHDDLVGLGFHPLLVDSNGKGGFHLRVLFEDPTITQHVRQLCRWLVRDWKSGGSNMSQKFFPSNPR